MPDESRRVFLGLSVGGVVGTALGCGGQEALACPAEADATTGQADPSQCATTGDDIEGPFYVEGAPERTDLDVNGSGGAVLDIRGVVLGDDCLTPLPGAVVEVWQADASGAYDNDSSAMAFRATIVADADGAYAFRSVLPGRYLNGTRYRPRHIHYKVSADGHTTLTTQLYFCGDGYIQGDPWAEEAPERAIVLSGDDDQGWQGVFDVVLAS